ncbi:MAG: hypothetical protein K0R38_7204 [Polyangiaceae bacterium]|nr:hypothetical protein [Polyangiaceae bacterium]
MNDFQDVLILQDRLGVESSGYDLPIALHRDRAFGQRERFHEAAHREPIGKGLCLTVHG